MDKQFKIYSVDTKSFYTDNEWKIHNERYEINEKINLMETWATCTKISKKIDMDFNEFQIKWEEYWALKHKESKTPNDEVKIRELKELFKKPKPQIKKSNIYKTAQEIRLEKATKEGVLKKYLKNELKDFFKGNDEYIELKNKIKCLNKRLEDEMIKSNIRYLNKKALNLYNQVTLFDNALSRAMSINNNELVMDMIIVRAYHYKILEQLIKYGFIYEKENGEIIKYKVFTASAGQIRTKKVIFIDEQKWMEYEKTLMCGLTIDDINSSSEKGCNINKFLAYLALCNSATDEISNFNIDKAIVIDDFETNVEGNVDYIDNKTFDITRKHMSIPIPHSDGCGWVLPSVSKKNFMIRLPWVKGLVTPVDYIKFCKEYNKGDYRIKDIYGKEWDLKRDKIEYVFTKSQFKMWKYYPNKLNKNGEIKEYGWDKYVRFFKEFKCKANMCNLEPDTKEFRKACFNYQMWQTLTDITEKEISYFTDKIDEFITKGYSDRGTMLKLLGADSSNTKKNYLQRCIEIYPELIRDYHVKEELASMLNARKKEAKYGKFKINATYTFLIPDVFAWMENVFLGHEKPIGILKNGELSCSLYKDNKELLVNRSPHLYREHGVRNNIIDDNTKSWFITDGIYTSSHDLISKVLQFDNDGDKGLVVAEPKLIEIAKRNMKGIVPLYYEMGKAKAQIINEKHIYESLTKAFSFNNIGKFSNKLTVMWNLNKPNLKTIAQITALNNFTIDGAKTLLVPEVPKNVQKEMKASNGKLPYFFQFAKDKDVGDVAEINDSTVNRICRNIEKIKQTNYDFSSIGKFNKNYLMNNSRIEINNEIIDRYNDLERNKNELYAVAKAIMGDEDTYVDIYSQIKKEFIQKCNDLNISLVDAIDMVTRYIYATNRNSKKGFLFDLFGDIIYQNLKNNIKKPLGEYIMCEICGERELNTNGRTLYCKKCAKEINIIKTRQKMKELRYNNV